MIHDNYIKMKLVEAHFLGVFCETKQLAKCHHYIIIFVKYNESYNLFVLFNNTNKTLLLILSLLQKIDEKLCQENLKLIKNTLYPKLKL